MTIWQLLFQIKNLYIKLKQILYRNKLCREHHCSFNMINIRRYWCVLSIFTSVSWRIWTSQSLSKGKPDVPRDHCQLPLLGNKRVNHLEKRKKETIVQYHYTSTKMAQMKNCWQVCRATRTLIHFFWEYKLVQSLKNCLAVSAGDE